MTKDAAELERAHAIFDPIAAASTSSVAGVDIGAMFGSEGLRIRGKVFAFVGFEGGLVVKVPEARVDELDGAPGIAERMVMRERPMREWVTVSRCRRGALGAAHRARRSRTSTRSRPLDAATAAAG